MNRDLVILGHHKIGPIPEGGWKSWYYVPTETFSAQLHLLLDRGYVFLTLEAFLDGVDKPETLPEKASLLTFDDGYRSLLRYALPTMRELDVPGVVFVPTDWVGRDNGFDHGVEPREEIATWEELAEMERGGLAVQPHGKSHRGLSTLTPEEVEAEIASPKRSIEEKLGRPALLFSFPFGDNGADTFTNGTRHEKQDSPLVDGLLQRYGYRAACVYGGDAVPLDLSHRYRLTRIALGADTDLAKALDSR